MNLPPNNEHYVPIALIQQILEARLEPTIQTLAFQLLARTVGNTVTLTKAEVIELCGVGSWNTARMHLTPLRAAKLAHITSNENVYLTWLQPNGLCYPPFDRQSLVIGDYGKTPIKSKDNVSCGDSENLADQSVVIGSSEKMPITGDWSKEGGTIYRTTDQLVSKYQNLLTDLGGLEGGNNPAQTKSLLTDPDVGMCEELAEAISVKIPFEVVLRHVFVWIHDCEAGKVRNVGALANRICNRWATVPLRLEDRQRPLYWRHVGNPYQPSLLEDLAPMSEPKAASVLITVELDCSTQPELAPLLLNTDGESVAEPDLQMPALLTLPPAITTTQSAATPTLVGESQQTTQPPAIDINQAWQLVLRQLEGTLPACTFNTWVKDTVPIGLSEGSLTVGVSNSTALDCLQNRLRSLIKRTVVKVIGQPIGITFQVAHPSMAAV